MVLALLKRLGFVINDSKCHIEPSNRFTYLGCVWDTLNWNVKLKKKRVENIKTSARVLLEKRTVSVRALAQFIGRVQSAVGIIPLARARSRALMFQFASICKSTEDYNKFLALSARAMQELQTWLEMPEGSSMPISTQGLPVVSIDTDSSLEGYGWFWKNSIFSEKIPEQWQGCHINILELWTLRQFLTTEGADLNNTVLCWRVDNNTALAAVRK